MLSVDEFVEQIGIASADPSQKVVVGRVSSEYPANLTKPQQWTLNEFINFGELQAGQLLGHVPACVVSE